MLPVLRVLREPKGLPVRPAPRVLRVHLLRLLVRLAPAAPAQLARPARLGRLAQVLPLLVPPAQPALLMAPPAPPEFPVLPAPAGLAPPDPRGLLQRWLDPPDLPETLAELVQLDRLEQREPVQRLPVLLDLRGLTA